MCGGHLAGYLFRVQPSVAMSVLEERVGFVGSVRSNDIGVKRVRIGGSGFESLTRTGGAKFVGDELSEL